MSASEDTERFVGLNAIKNHQDAFGLLDHLAASHDLPQLLADRTLDVGVGGLGDVDVEPSSSDDVFRLTEDGGADDDDSADLTASRADAVAAAERAANCFSNPFT